MKSQPIMLLILSTLLALSAFSNLALAISRKVKLGQAPSVTRTYRHLPANKPAPVVTRRINSLPTLTKANRYRRA